MNHTPVSSSNLASVGYDASTRILQIAFRNGSLYEYSNVPQHIYDGLMRASSHGRYFDAHIKNGGYAYRQLR